MLAFLAHSLLAMLSYARKVQLGVGARKKTLLLVMSNPTCIVFYSLICTFHIFSPLESRFS